MIAGGPAGLVRRWVRLYTRGLPAELRDGRRDEIDADLWSQLEEATLLGRPLGSTNTEIVTRWLAGIPADLSWRIEHRGDKAVTTTAPPPRVGSSGAAGLGLATVLAGVGLAALFVLFAISSRAVAPANPYYMSWPGTPLVLLGSAAELVLGSALFGYAIRYGDRFHRVATVAAAVGGLLAVLSALGAYTLIGALPVATAIVAWNGSPESNRAVAAALPLLAACGRVGVFCEPETKRGAASADELIGYLARHGVKAARVPAGPSHDSAAMQLLDAGARINATLLVMGAYTHGRLRQMVFGGVTQHVLHHATIPALLAH